MFVVFFFSFNFPSFDKKLKLFPNGYHELQHDEECEDLKKLVLDWILEKAQSSRPFGVMQKLKYGIEKKKKNNKYLYVLIFIVSFVLYYYK